MRWSQHLKGRPRSCHRRLVLFIKSRENGSRRHLLDDVDQEHEHGGSIVIAKKPLRKLKLTDEMHNFTQEMSLRAEDRVCVIAIVTLANRAELEAMRALLQGWKVADTAPPLYRTQCPGGR